MEKLDTFDKEMLLHWLKQHLTAEQRHKLMGQLPMAYNRWMGSVVVTVQHADDGRRVAPASSTVECEECGEPWVTYDVVRGVCGACRPRSKS